jgi:hypothetical protein
MRRYTFFLMVLACILSGCGGGGGSASNTVPLGTQTRRYQGTESYVYRITGTMTDGQQKVNVTGSQTVQLSNFQLDGSTYIQRDDFMVLEANGESFKTRDRSIFGQDTDNTLYYLGYVDEVGDFWPTEQAYIEAPGSPKVGYSHAQTRRFLDGSISDQTANYVRLETSKVPAGSFATIRNDATAIDPAGTTQSSIWLSPSVGAGVKQKMTLQSVDGFTATLTIELTQTNAL